MDFLSIFPGLKNFNKYGFFKNVYQSSNRNFREFCQNKKKFFKEFCQDSRTLINEDFLFYQDTNKLKLKNFACVLCMCIFKRILQGLKGFKKCRPGFFAAFCQTFLKNFSKTSKNLNFKIILLGVKDFWTQRPQ